MAFVMIQFLAGAIAWGFSLAFIRMKPQGIWFDSILIGLICAISSFFLDRTEYKSFTLLVELLLFLLLMVVVQLQQKGNYGDAVLAFFLSLGNGSLITFSGEYGYSLTGVTGLLPAAAMMTLSVFMTVKLKSRFPEEGWRDYFHDAVPEPERINLQLFHVYLIAVIIGMVPTAVRFFFAPIRLSEVLLLGSSGAGLFWIGVLLLLLMYAYKKERLAVLVEQQYREEMQSFLNVIRSQRHDYNFHVQTIAGLIESGNYEECRDYVNALVKDSEMMNVILPVQDPAISATISNFQRLAAREGMELHIDIQNDLSQIATNVYETNKIISNLLQNAIDETVRHKDKTYGIGLTILKRGEYCVIRVSNELEDRQFTAEELGQLYQQGYTTKIGHDGVGLSSIRVLASRYKGTVYTQLDGNVISFIAKIPINYAKRSAI